MERSPITPEGYAELVKQLKYYKEVLRPGVVKEIEEARAHGDLSENAEYDYAKDKQGMIEAQAAELENLVARAEIIDITKMPKSTRVIFGTTVELLDTETDEELEYRIVGKTEADVKAGKISYTSPIARALLGQNVGAEVRFQTPKGIRTLEILNVRYE
jgi:transcription elongation factor GreA